MKNKTLIVIFLAMGFFANLNFSQAAWVAPTGNPYSGNDSYPFVYNAAKLDSVYVLDKPFAVVNNFIVGSDVFYVNSSLNRVGVLTNTPQVMLDVAGVIRTLPDVSIPDCTSSLQGAIVFNSSQSRLNICVNEAWRRIGHDGDGDHWLDSADCDDSKPDINPGMEEICGNSVDENCNISKIDSCNQCFQDLDADGFGNPAISQYFKVCPGIGKYVLDNTDCNDNNSSINPDSEICGDSVTNDCDALINEVCDCTVGEWTAVPACPNMSTCTAPFTVYGTKTTSCIGTVGRPSAICPCTCRTDSWATIYCPECGSTTTIYADLKSGYSCEDTNNTRTSKVCVATGCPATSYSSNFCSDDDVYRSATSYTCSSGNCNSSSSLQKVTECGTTKECSGGVCVDLPCPTSPCSALQACCLSRGGTYLPEEWYSESSFIGCRCQIVTSGEIIIIVR